MRAALAFLAAVALAAGMWFFLRTHRLPPSPAPAAAPGAEPGPAPTHYQVELSNQLQSERLLQQLTAAETARDARRLARHEGTVYSQFGEDGIIAEIFRRVGVTNRYFVEFGSGDGSENNTVLLLEAGWSGLWLDAGPQFVRAAAERFRGKPLTVRQAVVNAENIQGLLAEAHTPQVFDLLSIDIDRNDYWVWKAITNYNPRVVVIEYNAVWPPGIAWAVDYQPEARWDNSSHTGASLTALERLGAGKGYVLVGCNLIGTNAFFVRKELAGDKFAAPFTAENHYQPPRYYLVWYKGGHPRQVGPPGLLDYPGTR